ncbi:dihydrodipicolinate synthase family protein [Amycolatopsis nigrescens]|uniref:dihydrodipicolinate synthase family protein n=1 Tax=Amycolatopsis nigrescens TaxID=381445 RepID=UPI0003A26D05|nr:dihydrodipicolinate synthase family protein [Amycolatopsis nigrescens]
MYSGTIVPLVTPLDVDGAVSARSVDRLVESVHQDVTALMPALSTGEGWQLSDRQWADMVALTRRHSRGLPVLAGVQAPTTEAVLARAKLGEELGVAAVVVGTPYGRAVTQDEIYRHYRALAAELATPMFIYNESAVSGNSAELETLLGVLALPGVVGVKESSGSPEFTGRVLRANPPVPVFQGWENLLADTPGVAGFIGPLANLEPDLCNGMLNDPVPDGQARVDEACARFELFADDWYLRVKRELVRRGVITTDRVVDEPKVRT